jgi:hypothetical protein
MAGDMSNYAEIDAIYDHLSKELSKLDIAYIHLVDHSAMGGTMVPLEIKKFIRNSQFTIRNSEFGISNSESCSRSCSLVLFTPGISSRRCSCSSGGRWGGGRRRRRVLNGRRNERIPLPF